MDERLSGPQREVPRPPMRPILSPLGISSACSSACLSNCFVPRVVDSPLATLQVLLVVFRYRGNGHDSSRKVEYAVDQGVARSRYKTTTMRQEDEGLEGETLPEIFDDCLRAGAGMALTGQMTASTSAFDH